jgi:hypothetical protein
VVFLFLNLVMAIPAVAVVAGFFVAPQLLYAYPPYFFVGPYRLVLATWLSIALMAALSMVFAFFTRNRSARDQWLLAFASFGAWWLLCRLALGFAGLEAAWQPRM